MNTVAELRRRNKRCCVFVIFPTVSSVRSFLLQGIKPMILYLKQIYSIRKWIYSIAIKCRDFYFVTTTVATIPQSFIHFSDIVTSKLNRREVSKVRRPCQGLLPTNAPNFTNRVDLFLEKFSFVRNILYLRKSCALSKWRHSFAIFMPVYPIATSVKFLSSF